MSASPHPAPAAYSLPELLRLHGPRMLVVEDDRDLEPLVRRAVAALSPPVAVDWCATAEDARALLARRRYDVVLADYALGGRHTGLALRADCERLQPRAVFAMTSSYPLDDYLRCVGRPRQPLLRKPFAMAACRTFVRALLLDAARAGR